MKTQSDLVTVEEKGCITFSRVCVNLGKVLNLETRREEYYCGHDFPIHCEDYGCPKLITLADPSTFRLQTFKRKGE